MLLSLETYYLNRPMQKTDALLVRRANLLLMTTWWIVQVCISILNKKGNVMGRKRTNAIRFALRHMTLLHEIDGLLDLTLRTGLFYLPPKYFWLQITRHFFCICGCCVTRQVHCIIVCNLRVVSTTKPFVHCANRCIKINSILIRLFVKRLIPL